MDPKINLWFQTSGKSRMNTCVKCYALFYWSMPHQFCPMQFAKPCWSFSLKSKGQNIPHISALKVPSSSSSSLIICRKLKKKIQDSSARSLLGHLCVVPRASNAACFLGLKMWCGKQFTRLPIPFKLSLSLNALCLLNIKPLQLSFLYVLHQLYSIHAFTVKHGDESFGKINEIVSFCNPVLLSFN